jgi:hypothetical protein
LAARKNTENFDAEQPVEAIQEAIDDDVEFVEV